MDKKEKAAPEVPAQEQNSFTEREKEIAFKILSDLEGVLVVKATSILKFCLKTIQFNEVNIKSHKTLNQMRNDFGLKPIENGDVIFTYSNKNKLP